jgi:hypothetical protein
VYIEELKDQKKKVEESCKLAQDADKKKVDQIRRMHSEHEQELAKLKRSSWQEGRKQVCLSVSSKLNAQSPRGLLADIFYPVFHVKKVLAE